MHKSTSLRVIALLFCAWAVAADRSAYGTQQRAKAISDALEREAHAAVELPEVMPTVLNYSDFFLFALVWYLSWFGYKGFWSRDHAERIDVIRKSSGFVAKLQEPLIFIPTWAFVYTLLIVSCVIYSMHYKTNQLFVLMGWVFIFATWVSDRATPFIRDNYWFIGLFANHLASTAFSGVAAGLIWAQYSDSANGVDWIPPTGFSIYAGLGLWNIYFHWLYLKASQKLYNKRAASAGNAAK